MAKRRRARKSTGKKAWSPWFSRLMASKGYSRNPRKGKKTKASAAMPAGWNVPDYGVAPTGPAPARKYKSKTKRKSRAKLDVARGVYVQKAPKQKKAAKPKRKTVKSKRRAAPTLKQLQALGRARELRSMKARMAKAGVPADYMPPLPPGPAPYALGRVKLVKADPGREKRKGKKAPGWYKIPGRKAGYRYYPNPRRGRKGRFVKATSRRRHRRGYRRNPGFFGGLGTTLKAMAKPVLAGSVGFFASRVIGNTPAVTNMIPESFRGYMPVAAGFATAIATWLIGKKVSFIRKYETPIMMGAALSMVEGIVTLAVGGVPQLASVRPYVNPLAGMGDDLDVYEAALRGRGLQEEWGDAALLRGISASDGGVGEYIEDPNMGEYLLDPGMGEYIDEGTATAFEDDQGYIDVPEGEAGEDYQELMTGDGLGVEAYEDFAGFTAEEGLAEYTGVFGDNGGGIFSGDDGLGDLGVEQIAGNVFSKATQQGASPKTAAEAATNAVKAAAGAKKTTPAMRARITRGIRRVMSGGRVPIKAVATRRIAPPVKRTIATPEPYDESGGGIFGKSIFG